MKITPAKEAVGFLTVVRERKDGSGEGHSQERAPKDDQEGSENSPEKSFEATVETLGKAVSEFESDGNAQANGLHANVSGKGPGLKVVLTDASGQVVRQFTGEEFLKLREAAQSPGKRGRILDQKF